MDDLNTLNPGSSLPEPLDSSVPSIPTLAGSDALDPIEGGFKSSIPGVPVSLPGFALHTNDSLSTNALTKDVESVYGQPNLNPIDYPLIMGGVPFEQGMKPPPKQAGFFEHLGYSFFENNAFLQAGEYAYDTYEKLATADSDSGEGFNQFDFNEFKDYPQAYWPDILDAINGTDRKRIQQKIRDQMDHDARFQSGGLAGDILGGIGGFATGSVGGLLGIASAGKFASITENTMRNVIRASPMLAADSIVRQSLIAANTYGQSASDTAKATLIDFAFNTTLFGAGKAFEAGSLNMKLWNSRKLMKPVSEGINMDFETLPDGTVVGIRASLSQQAKEGILNSSISAMKTTELTAAQMLADEVMQQSGFFSLPGAQHVLKAFSFGSPVIKAATSPFDTVKGFFNRVTSHGLITKGEEAGIATPDQAYTIAKYYQDQGLKLGNWVRGKFYEANGIESGGTYLGALKNLKQTFSNQNTISHDEFGQEVRRVMTIKGYKSKTSQVNEVSEALQKYFDEMNIEHHKALGEDHKFLDPRNAFKYLPTNYNIPMMIARPDRWIELTAGAYAQQHAMIQRVMNPIKKSNARIKELRTLIKATEKGDRKSLDYKNQLRAAKGLRERQQTELIDNIHNNPDLYILLQDRVPFSPEELKELKKLHEPFDKINREIQKHSDQINEIKSAIQEKEHAIKSSGSKKGAESIKESLRAEIESLKKDISLRGNRIKFAQEKIDKIRFKLMDEALAGRIDRKFYDSDYRGVHLRPAKFNPKFRNIPGDIRAQVELAQQVFDTITNQSSEDIMASIFGHGHGIKDRPDYLKNRSHLVDQSIYINDGFLDPDISKSVSAYSNSMGRVIGWNKAFGVDGKNQWSDMLKKELHEKQADIPHPVDSPEHRKALSKLDKQFKEATDLMNDTYKVYMGTYNSSFDPKWQALAHTMRNIVASAKLGSVPIYQLTELSYIALKSSMMNFMTQGMRPLLKAVFTQAKDPEWHAIRKNAADFYIGLNHLTQSTGQLFGSSSQNFAHMGSFISSAANRTEQLAHLAGDLYGINMLANINEVVSSNAFQSEIMRAAFEHRAGTISKDTITKMAHIGIDLDAWGSKFISQYEKSQGWEVAGGYQSNAYLWNDLEAAQRFRLSVRRAVEDTMVNRDLFSKPYFLANNPIASMVFMFHGWAYGALSRYTLPSLQRADAKTLAGLITVVGSSLMSEPLLRLANGKEMFEDDDTWMQNAFKSIDYSGILGPSLTILQDINKISGNVVLPQGLVPERTKAQPGFSGALGPILGYLDSGARIGSHAFTGQFTHGDASGLARMIPLMSGIPQRTALNNWVESLGLPEKRADVEPWAWYSWLHNNG